jgi:hypothetical protein
MTEKLQPYCPKDYNKCGRFSHFINADSYGLEVHSIEPDNNSIESNVLPGKCNSTANHNGKRLTPCDIYNDEIGIGVFNKKTGEKITNPAFSPDNQ